MNVHLYILGRTDRQLAGSMAATADQSLRKPRICVGRIDREASAKFSLEIQEAVTALERLAIPRAVGQHILAGGAKFIQNVLKVAGTLNIGLAEFTGVAGAGEESDVTEKLSVQ
jgi:hypothetical protein